MSAPETGGVGWDVVMPARGSRPGSPARVVFDCPGMPARAVPSAVGRRLARQLREGKAPEAGERLDVVVDELVDQCARERVEQLVSRRDYSAEELGTRLRRDGYPGDVVDRRVCRARESGVVDDARYAASFVRSKALAGWGRTKIERALAARGVSLDALEGLSDELLSEDDELARARELAERRARSGRGELRSLVRFLCGRGFSPGVAYRAARTALGDED